MPGGTVMYGPGTGRGSAWDLVERMLALIQQHVYSTESGLGHDAARIKTSAIAGLTATNVQAALAEHQVDIDAEIAARIIDVNAEETRALAAEAAEVTARSLGAVATYRPVVGGAATSLPANLVLPTDGSTFDVPLVALTDPVTLAQSWLVVDPDQIAGNDGDAIQTFTPAKGTAFSQATTAKRPTIRTNVLDGHRALRPDGVDDAMAQVAGAAKAQPNTYLAIAKVTETAQTRRLLDSLSGSTTHLLRTNLSKWEMSGGTVLAGGAVTGSWRAVEARFNGAASSLALDGGTPVTGDAGTQAPTGVTLFANSGQSTQFWQGDLAYLITLASADAALILSQRRWLAERFPSVPILTAAEKPTNDWYPEGYVQVGPSTVLHYTAKTANKLTGCRVVVGAGTVTAGAAVTQVRPGSTSAAAVRTPQAVPLVGASLQDQLGEVASHLNEQGVNVARAPYFASPVQTPLYNSDAINAAIQSVYSTNGERGGKVTIPRYTAPLLIDPATGSGVPANRKSITLNRPNIELHILPGAVVKPSIQTVDQYDVIFAGYGGGLGKGCTLRVDGQLLGDLRGRTTQSPGGPQAGHCVRLGGHLNFRVCGTGTIGESWGDLLYVGEDPDEPDYRRSSGLLVGSHLLWTEARREAIGAFNGDDMKFLGLWITDTGKLANAQGVPVVGGPQRGFDAEPNITNPLRPEAIRRLTVDWCVVTGCYGAGFVLGGGQGAVCDQIVVGWILSVGNGLTANFSSDDGVVLAHMTNLDVGQIISTDNVTGHGLLVKGDCTGHVGSVISARNWRGFRMDTANGSYNPALTFGSVKTYQSIDRGQDWGINRDDVIVNELSAYGDSQTGTNPSVRVSASSVGKLRARSGRIRRADEEQRIRITGSPTGGTWTVSPFGTPTAGIAWNATKAQVQSALEAHSGVGAGNVVVSGGQGPALPYVVRFVGALEGTDIPLMTASAAGLTGGTAPAVAVELVTPGGGDQTYLLEVASGTGHEFDRVDLGGKSGSSGRVLDSGILTKFTHCPGFPTEATAVWSIPSGSTFVDVPHGMGRRPRLREVKISLSGAPGNGVSVWVAPEGLTDTHVRVQASGDPGATGVRGTMQATAQLGQPAAIAGAHHGDLNDNTDLASYAVTVSTAPTANAQVLVFVGSAAATTPNVPTISGLGITNWTQVATSASNNRRGTIFRGSAANPVSGALTIDFAGQTQQCCEASVDGFTAGGIGDFPAVAEATGTSLASAQTFTSDGSGTYMAVRMAANEAITEEAGWTRLVRNNHTAPTAGWLVAWRPTPDTTPSASWTSSVAGRIISVELLPTS